MTFLDLFAAVPFTGPFQTEVLIDLNPDVYFFPASYRRFYLNSKTDQAELKARQSRWK